jgi:hypothetical protein
MGQWAFWVASVFVLLVAFGLASLAFAMPGEYITPVCKAQCCVYHMSMQGQVPLAPSHLVKPERLQPELRMKLTQLQ